MPSKNAHESGLVNAPGPSGSGPATANAVSVRSLHALFADEGDSVSAYVRRRRLARAYAELTRAGSSASVTEIAFRLGFTDLAHFSRAFREQYGITPSAARRGPTRGSTVDE